MPCCYGHNCDLLRRSVADRGQRSELTCTQNAHEHTLEIQQEQQWQWPGIKMGFLVFTFCAWGSWGEQWGEGRKDGREGGQCICGELWERVIFRCTRPHQQSVLYCWGLLCQNAVIPSGERSMGRTLSHPEGRMKRRKKWEAEKAIALLMPHSVS